LQADIDQNETDGDAADTVLQSNINAEETRALAAEAVLQDNINNSSQIVFYSEPTLVGSTSNFYTIGRDNNLRHDIDLKTNLGTNYTNSKSKCKIELLFSAYKTSPDNNTWSGDIIFEYFLDGSLQKTFVYDINWTDPSRDFTNIKWYHNILIFEDNLSANSQISFKVYSPTYGGSVTLSKMQFLVTEY
jgi:hypothetical protein